MLPWRILYVLFFGGQCQTTAYFTSPSPQFNSFDPVKIKSHPGVRSDLFNRPLSQTLLTDFFGGVSQIEVDEEASQSSGQDDEQYAALLEDLSPSSASSSSFPPPLGGEEDHPQDGEGSETVYHSPPLGFDEQATIEKLEKLKAEHEQKVKERLEEVRRGKAWEEKVRVMRTWAGLGVLVMLVGFVMWQR
jgi:hypothetical protein